MGIEILNLVVICQETYPTNIIANLLQFFVIAQIDEFLSMTVKNNLAKSIFEEQVTLSTKSLGTADFDPLLINKTRLYKSFFIKIYWMLQIFYDSIYFYFMPYLTFILSFVLI